MCCHRRLRLYYQFVTPLGGPAVRRHPVLERVCEGRPLRRLEQPDLFVNEVRSFFRLVR
jgi:hypothetical protein